MTLGSEAIAALTAGAVLIAIICWRDANEKMSRKTSNPLLKAFVYCIFLLLTLALYLAISYWFVPELFDQDQVDAATFTKVLGIALLTFGAGSTTYPAIGDLKVSPYRMLLDLLMSTIPDPTPVDDLGKLRKEVRQRKCHQLITGARDLRNQAIQDERWDELGDEWTDLGLDYLWCELTELNTLDTPCWVSCWDASSAWSCTDRVQTVFCRGVCSLSAEFPSPCSAPSPPTPSVPAVAGRTCSGWVRSPG